MTRTWSTYLVVAAMALVSAGAARARVPQTGTPAALTLGSVRLTQAAKADGKPLPAGTYQVRLTADEPTAVVGQSPQAERWVEFVKGGQVAGRELASVVSAADIEMVAKEAPPQMGTSRVEILKGGEYLRVWIASHGQHYLIHLAVSH